MDLRKIKRIWIGSLVPLVMASYTWPGFGVAFVALMVLLIAHANHLLSIRSKELGLVIGCSTAVLVLATSLGAGLSVWQVALFSAIGGLAGYAFSALAVASSTSTNSAASRNDRSSGVKAGGDGDFGGGGASGKY